MSTQRHLMYRELERYPPSAIKNERRVCETDGLILGHLMYESYQGTIDYEGESRDQAIQEMTETLGGKYGEMNFPASFVVMEQGMAIAAALFVYYKKENLPLLAYTMTHPRFQGRGLSQALIKKGMTALFEQGHRQCCLVVTEGNQPAQSIYQKMGFSVFKKNP